MTKNQTSATSESNASRVNYGKQCAVARTSRRAELMSPEAGTIEVQLAKHAGAIRALGRRVVTDIIAIGNHLIAAKADCKDGGENFGDWLKREFEWSQETANKIMRVAELSESRNPIILENLSISGLYLLAKPSTPDEAREEVLEAAKNGKLTHKQVKQMIADAEAKEAKRQEQVLAKLKAKHEQLIADRDAEIAKLEEELKGVLTPKEIAKAIADAVEPFKEKLERYKKHIADLEGKAKPRVQDKYGLSAANVSFTLEKLAEAVQHITPKEMIAAKQLQSEIGKRPLPKILAADLERAAIVVGWLETFQEQTGGLT